MVFDTILVSAYGGVDDHTGCEHCIVMDDHFECEECSDLLPAVARAPGQYICIPCRDEHYFTCTVCRSVSHNDNHYTNDGDESICYSCWSNASDEDDDTFNTNQVIRDYSDRAANFLGPFGDIATVRYGIELEVERTGTGRTDSYATKCLEKLGKDFAIAKHDGSLTDGFELVTAPADLPTHWNRWTRLLEDRPKGLASFKSQTCGMHVHVSRKYHDTKTGLDKPLLSHLQIGKLLVFVNADENRGFITSVAGRTGKRWARRSKKNVSDGAMMDDDRYQAINITGQWTIEFRIFRGTLALGAVLKNLEFCAASVEWSKDASMQALGWQDFVAFVSRTPRRWPNLSKWLRTKGYMEGGAVAKAPAKRPPVSGRGHVVGEQRYIGEREYTWLIEHTPESGDRTRRTTGWHYWTPSGWRIRGQ
jgi:hypothetical protein